VSPHGFLGDENRLVPPIWVAIANPTSQPTPWAVIKSGTYRRCVPSAVAFSTALWTAGVCGEPTTGSEA
jgi:hypothetical protein